MEPKPEEQEVIRQAMSLIGRKRTERKTASSRVNAARATEARRGQPASEETKAKLRAAQQARRERERAEEAVLLAEIEKQQGGQTDGE